MEESKTSTSYPQQRDRGPTGEHKRKAEKGGKQRKGGKMEKLWLGPYTIHTHLGKGVYELRNKAGHVMKKAANINRLKF